MKDKVTDEQKKTVEEKADAILEAVKAKDVEKAETLRKDLEDYFRPISEAMYKAAAEATNESASATTASDSTTAPEAEDVEFEEVK